MAYLRLERFIRHVTLSGLVGYEKPDPRIFAAALAQAGVDPDESVYVGDRLNVDVAGTTAAGMRAIWYNHRGDPLIEGFPPPVITITRFTELPAALAAVADA